MTILEIDGRIVEDAPFHDMSDHGCQNPDKCDFIVNVGVIVSFTELTETPETAGKVYFVVNMPDYGNMVELAEITDMSGEWQTWKANPDIPVISVEPWKIGLI